MAPVASTAQVAAAVLKACTNVIHAAYIHRKMVDDEMLLQVLDDVRELASLVTSSASFWILDPTLPVSPEMIKVSDALKSVLKECSVSLERFEELLEIPMTELVGWTGFGAKPMDLGLLGWKINCYSAAVGLVLDMVKTDEHRLRQIDLESFGEQARWYMLSIEQIDDRGKTGELLVEEIFAISDHMKHLEELAAAVKQYSAARGRQVVERLKVNEGVKEPNFLDMIRSAEAEALQPLLDDFGRALTSRATKTDGNMHSIQGPAEGTTPGAHVAQSAPDVGGSAQDTQDKQISQGGDSMSTEATNGSTVARSGSIYTTATAANNLQISHPSENEPNVFPTLQGEPEEVARIVRLIKEKDYPTAEKLLDRLMSRMALGAVASKLTLAEYFYNARHFDRVISLLQIPLVTLQSDMAAAGRIDHLLAKTYFACGNLNRAMDYCNVGVDRTRKQFGIYHATYLQLLELQIQIYRADGRPEKAHVLRFEQFLPGQCEFLEAIDALEAAFKMGDKGKAFEAMTSLVEDLRPQGAATTMRTHSSFIDRLGPSDGWDFHTTVLGFHDDHSLLTILADLDDIDRVMLLCLRGNATIGLAAGRTRSALDLLLRSAALAGQSGRIDTLLDVGADIEADRDHMLWWRHVGEEYASMSPLHIATKAAHIDVVKVLIKRGANIEAKTSSGKTALMIADENSHPDIFTFLLEKGAKVE